MDLPTGTARGSPIVGLPKDKRYVLPGVELGDPAKPEMDYYGLDAVVAEIRAVAR
jgi:hypothetical protein